MQNTSSYIYNVFLAVGIVIAIVVGIVIGMKFMLSSIDEKAKIKEMLIAYVIGVFVLFAAYGIWSIVVNMGKDITSTSSSAIIEGSTKCPSCQSLINPLLSKCSICGAEF